MASRRRGQPFSESLDAIDQLTAAERRARTYVSRDEMLLAGDVIFTEVQRSAGGRDHRRCNHAAAS